MSPTVTAATVQVPASTNVEKPIGAVFVTEVAGMKLPTPRRMATPEGLRNATSILLTPEASVAVKFTLTLAAIEEVSIDVGVKLKAVKLGAVESAVDATTNVTGNCPANAAVL